MDNDRNQETNVDEPALDLNVDAAPEPVGVYDRPEKTNTVGRNVVVLFAIFVLLVLAYFALTSILPAA